MGLTREATHKGDPVGREVELTSGHTGNIGRRQGKREIVTTTLRHGYAQLCKEYKASKRDCWGLFISRLSDSKAHGFTDIVIPELLFCQTDWGKSCSFWLHGSWLKQFRSKEQTVWRLCTWPAHVSLCVLLCPRSFFYAHHLEHCNDSPITLKPGIVSSLPLWPLPGQGRLIIYVEYKWMKEQNVFLESLILAWGVCLDLLL